MRPRDGAQLSSNRSHTLNSSCMHACTQLSGGDHIQLQQFILDRRRAGLASMAAWLLIFQSYLDYLKCSPHKPILCSFFDGTVRYQSEINKSHPSISTCPRARLNLMKPPLNKYRSSFEAEGSPGSEVNTSQVSYKYWVPAVGVEETYT